MKATASACGKIILFGEHAVVYNSPAIAVPISSLHAKVSVQEADTLIIDARNLSAEYQILKKPLKKKHTAFALQETIFNTLKHFNLSKNQKLRVIIDSKIPIATGMGSGAAVAVAMIRALAAFFKKKITKDELYNLAHKTEVIHHGTPSGVDLAVIINEKPVFFKKGEVPETLTLKNKCSLVIGDTGVQSRTSEVVADVKANWEKYEEEFAEIRTIVEQARSLIESGDVLRLGPLMDDNHGALQKINVSSPELDTLVKAAREAGALGAKLSGAGKGGNMIALADGNGKAISQALMDTGAARVYYAEII